MYILVLFLLSDPSHLAVYSPSGDADGVVKFKSKSACEEMLKEVEPKIKAGIPEPFKLECRKV
jgi:hypothetical protein